VPKAGGMAMKQILSECYKLVTACVGVLPGLLPINPPREQGVSKPLFPNSALNVEFANLRHGSKTSFCLPL